MKNFMKIFSVYLIFFYPTFFAWDCHVSLPGFNRRSGCSQNTNLSTPFGHCASNFEADLTNLTSFAWLKFDPIQHLVSMFQKFDFLYKGNVDVTIFLLYLKKMSTKKY